MLITYSINNTMYAFSRPSPTKRSQATNLTRLFPCYSLTMPSAFEQLAFDLSFMVKPIRVFRSSPPITTKEYLAWINKVQAKKKKHQEKLGIYDMVNLSRIGLRYNPCMLLASIFFWEGSTNTFQLSYGMLSLTLFNVASITGLNLVSSIFYPTLETQHKFTIKHFTYKTFIFDNHDTANEDVSDQEHISFLAFWTSYYVFCSSSLHVAKKFVPLAIQLQEGKKISLNKLLMVNLYQSLGDASYKLKHLYENSKIKYFLVSCPLAPAIVVECHF